MKLEMPTRFRAVRGSAMRTTNRLTLIGHVASIKPFQKATKVTVTTKRSWTSNGERQERASYVPVALLDAHQAKWAAENVRGRRPRPCRGPG